MLVRIKDQVSLRIILLILLRLATFGSIVKFRDCDTLLFINPFITSNVLLSLGLGGSDLVSCGVVYVLVHGVPRVVEIVSEFIPSGVVALKLSDHLGDTVFPKVLVIDWYPGLTQHSIKGILDLSLGGRCNF